MPGARTLHGLPPALAAAAQEPHGAGGARQDGARGPAGTGDPQEGDGVGVWEPWKPKLGDRVRVHLSAECRQEWPAESSYPRHPKIIGHVWEWDGLVGTVRQIDSRDTPYGHHPYVVLFDRKQRCPHCPRATCLHLILGIRLAASEIIPLEGSGR
jgi:hypothetical protein